jgi:uncharacterized repeat protein (TIGR03803 family)
MKKILLLSLLTAVAGINFSSAQSNALIGTCYGGGTTGMGTIFQANLDGSNVHAIYSFPNLIGQAPWGKTAQAANGKIYGVTYLGGCADSCTLYEYDPVTGVGYDVYDFWCTPPSGEPAQGGLIVSADGNLYGLVQNGIIYQFNPNTHVYTVLHQASATSYTGGLMQAADGKLYGTSTNGGTYGYGTVFSYDLTSHVYSVIYSFDGTHGRAPYYLNLIQAANGNIYGTTYMGGANNAGVLFSYDVSSTTNPVLYNFNGTNGSSPYGGVIQASNGKLYGMTNIGGTSNYGVIFSYDISENQYSVLYNFNGTDGANPMRSLTQAGNGKLFGTTNSGGLYSKGVAFSYDIESGAYTKLIDFNTASGSNPQCDIMEARMPEPTGISSQGALQNSVYLDAASNQLVVQNIRPEANAVLTVFDASGRNVFQTGISSGNSAFDMSSFSEGVYFAQLRNGAQSVNRRIILSRQVR